MNALISIIMPVYNCENYIQESIKSILSQTYTNWELIIVNDNSSDKTMEKIKNFIDKRIHIVDLKEHLGFGKAFYKGYDLAKGDLVSRHDGDDISAKNRLDIQKKYLDENPEIGAVSCLISSFTSDPIFRKDCIFIERIQNYYITYEEIKKATIEGFLPILFPTLLIRKKIFDKIYSEKKYITNDVELSLNLIEKCTIEKINTILYYYRRHSSAYHVLNQRESEGTTKKLLKDPTVKNHLQFKDFYEDIIIPPEDKLHLNTKSPTRVLMLIDALNVGGTETYVLDITKKLISMGIYVVIATSGGPMEGLMESYGIKIIKIPLVTDYISNKKKNGLLKLIKAIVDKEQINIIHCHLFASMQLASELYRLYRIPYIVTIHGLFYPGDILYSTCINAASVIAVSEPVRKMLNKQLGDRIKSKITVIPNGIDPNLNKNINTNYNIYNELHIPQNAKVLCYCSRLDWNKTNVARVFLFSFSQLIQKIPNIHAIIIGDGPGKEAIEKEAQIINETANKKIAHVVGAKVNVLPYYNISTIIIGTARVALEALACEKPVIAIGNQGYTGIIHPKNQALQIQMYFGDHDCIEKPNVSTLAKDIKYLLFNPEETMRLKKWGRKWCEKYFNNAEMVSKIIDVYNEVIKAYEIK